MKPEHWQNTPSEEKPTETMKEQNLRPRTWIATGIAKILESLNKLSKVKMPGRPKASGAPDIGQNTPNGAPEVRGTGRETTDVVPESLESKTDRSDIIPAVLEIRQEITSVSLTSPPAPIYKLIAPLPEETRQCISCLEDYSISRMMRAVCSHYWCRTCLQSLTEASLMDDSIFPSRCCDLDLRITSCRFLPFHLYREYLRKESDYVRDNYTFCSNLACSPLKHTPTVRNGRCNLCQKRTCSACKRLEQDCVCPEEYDWPEDEESQAVLRLAKRQGWQQCTKCKHLIELDFGCYHISKFLFTMNPGRSIISN